MEEEEILKLRHQKEYSKKLEEIENNSPTNPKPSLETLNSKKSLEQALKRKEYYFYKL